MGTSWDMKPALTIFAIALVLSFSGLDIGIHDNQNHESISADPIEVHRFNQLEQKRHE